MFLDYKRISQNVALAVVAAAWWACLSATSGCGGAVETNASATGPEPTAAGGPAETSPPGVQVAHARTLPEPAAVPEPRTLEHRPRAARLAAELLREALVRRDRGAPEGSTVADLALALLPKKHHARKVIRETYKVTGGALVFSAEGEVLPAARQLLQAVRELPSHGMGLGSYPLETAEKSLAAVEARAAAAPPASTWEGKLGELVTWVDQVSPDTPVDTLEQRLLAAGLTDEHADMVARVRERQKEMAEQENEVTKTLVALDVALLECFYRYALDFRYLKVAHPFRAMRDPMSGWMHFHDKLLEDFKSTSMSDLNQTLQAWWPQNPVYAQLRVGLALYERLAAEEQQPEIPKGTFKKGSESDAVKVIQARLRQEGYYAGDDTGAFDEATDEAVRVYQASHQLDVDGVVGGTTTKSMNVPYIKRVEQIRLGLQRWRESEARYEPGMYFRVNIPQFIVELWDGGTKERLRRHNVVVGSNAWEKDPERGVEGNLNRTMLFSDAMEMVVLNPLWHVPNRIRDTEIAVEVAKDPDYLAKHNYTAETLEDGTLKIFQNSGPGNALGLVKFLFPNEFSIYMHDTPKKKLFGRTIRAFSHGCIRVHEPLDLARYLLVEKEGKFTSEEFDAALEAGRERGIKLDTPIPVHIDYNTVSMDDNGHVMFLIDIYQYDKAYYDGHVPLPKRNFKALDG